MLLSTLTALLLGVTVASAGKAYPSKKPKNIERDIAIIGGGSSGAYSAVRLRDDYGKSIALIEMEDRLGGMVNTYIDPKTGTAYDYGVESFLDIGKAQEFFDRFDVETESLNEAGTTTEYIDFLTGQVVDLETPSADDAISALEKFLDIVEPWTNFTQPGYWDFPNPEDIPADMLIPYGEFITKHGLENAVPWIYASTGLGLGNMSNAVTLFELQAFGTYMAESYLGEVSGYGIKGGNQALYNAIEEDLGDDVLYKSKVIESKRTDSGVTLTVQTKDGQITEVKAKQLLIAIEPTQANLTPLDLDQDEKVVLSKFTFTREYCGILNNTALEANITYFNMAQGAAPDNYLVLPNFPFVNEISYMGGDGDDNLFHVIIVGDDNTNEADALSLAQKSFNTLLEAGRFAKGAQKQELSWVDFSVHGAMHARVSAEDVKAGFFQDLYKLQGQRSTWWTGGAFSCNFQTTLWEFDETLFPKILAELA